MMRIVTDVSFVGAAPCATTNPFSETRDKKIILLSPALIMKIILLT